MAAPRMISWHDSWASPYAPELHIIGDDNLLDMLERSEVETIAGVNVDTAKSGNKTFWRVGFGGEWVLVKVHGNLQLENYPNGRKPVDGMKYLPLLPGERFEGKMGYGKRRSYSVYAVVITVEGVTLTPIDRETWGDRAYDVTGTTCNKVESASVASPEPVVATAIEPDESPMAIAMRKAGLIS